MSSNVFKGVCNALSALYVESPAVGVVGAIDGVADQLLESGGIIDNGGLWPLMQRIQLFTIGLREMFLRVDINERRGGILYRPVSPDYVWASAPAGDPMNPDHLWELRLRMGPHRKLIWTYDRFDLRDLNNPIYEVRAVSASGELAGDLTEIYLGGDMSGESYPYRDSSGTPVMPYALYHAQLLGDQLFDPFTLAELVAGSLTSAVLHCFLVHICRDCSFPQRYVMGCGIDAGTVYDADGTSRRIAIASDPASILVFSPDPEMAGAGQPVIGQFSAGGDESKLMQTITLYERKLAQSAGISPASVQKISGDPRSGYAIAMSKSDQRDFQRRFTGPMRRGDLTTMRLSAIIANRFLGHSFPESGYRIEYSSIPLSPEESKGLRDDIIDKMNNGLLTKIDAIRTLYPDLSDDQAGEYLREIKRQTIEFG